MISGSADKAFLRQGKGFFVFFLTKLGKYNKIMLQNLIFCYYMCEEAMK